MAGQASWISRIRPRPSTTCPCDEQWLGCSAILSHVPDRSISVSRSRVRIHEPTTRLLLRRDRHVVPFTLRGWIGSDRRRDLAKPIPEPPDSAAERKELLPPHQQHADVEAKR